MSLNKVIDRARTGGYLSGVRHSFYQYPYSELKSLWAAHGLTEPSASMVFNWHYKKNRREACTHHNLPAKTKSFMAENLDFGLPAIHTVKESADQTVKFLFAMADGRQVETVLIPFLGKYSVCVSSQVGCAVNCKFCYTGTQGFTRNLKTEEIVGQLLGVQTWLSANRPGADKISNVVYMGQGEPLLNFEAVRDSASIFLSQHGVSLAPRKVTVSTSGHVPGLLRWRDEMPNVNIALSLHSPDAEKRSQLIPMNRRWGLDEILPLVDAIPRDEERFVTYEYVMLDAFNDSDEDAHATGRLLHGKKAYINLIPFISFPAAKFRRSSPERILRFKSILDTYNIPTLIRTTKGDDVLAACGQLKV
jgi:23S rRNA (adenine2503-C2)-methyltransferase